MQIDIDFNPIAAVAPNVCSTNDQKAIWKGRCLRPRGNGRSQFSHIGISPMTSPFFTAIATEEPFYFMYLRCYKSNPMG